MHNNAIKIVGGGVKFSKKYFKMWDFLSKNCGIFSIEGGTKLWDFQHRGGDFRPLTSGHTAQYFSQIQARCSVKNLKILQFRVLFDR